MPSITTADLAMLVGQVTAMDPAADDGERIDRIRHFEQLKAALSAAQMATAVEFAESRKTADAERGVPAVRRGRSAAAEIGLARRINGAAAVVGKGADFQKRCAGIGADIHELPDRRNPIQEPENLCLERGPDIDEPLIVAPEHGNAKFAFPDVVRNRQRQMAKQPQSAKSPDIVVTPVHNPSLGRRILSEQS